MREKKVYIRPEDSLEFVYEIMDKYKDTGSADEAIEKLEKSLKR